MSQKHFRRYRKLYGNYKILLFYNMNGRIVCLKTSFISFLLKTVKDKEDDVSIYGIKEV